MAAYYNEIDPFNVQLLRNLIAGGHIAPGDVDERSIRDVRSDDLRGYTQCHFFAGIGGWSVALRLAGWPDDLAVWTGSCPCQPFSEAGQHKGFADERDLWPTWKHIIGERRPPIAFGEQVARGDGVVWFDRTAADMEDEGYPVGASVLPACGVGAGHRRDRFFLVADTIGSDPRGRLADRGRVTRPQPLASPWAYANWQSEHDYNGRVADGISARVAKSAAGGFGNAIVPQIAAKFITAAA